MPWTIDKASAEYAQLTKSEQAKYDIFQNAIQNQHKHPKQAAEEAGDTDYKLLQGDQYQIRLSQGNRVTFTVNPTSQVVTILQVGRHT